MVTSLIKTRLSVQTSVEVGMEGRRMTAVVVGCSGVEVGDESGAGDGVGELPPSQAVKEEHTYPTSMIRKQMATDLGKNSRVSIYVLERH
jgi:hypothetical protein